MHTAHHQAAHSYTPCMSHMRLNCAAHSHMLLWSRRTRVDVRSQLEDRRPTGHEEAVHKGRGGCAHLQSTQHSGSGCKEQGRISGFSSVWAQRLRTHDCQGCFRSVPELVHSDSRGNAAARSKISQWNERAETKVWYCTWGLVSLPAHHNFVHDRNAREAPWRLTNRCEEAKSARSLTKPLPSNAAVLHSVRM